jgi:hypothetical protein
VKSCWDEVILHGGAELVLALSTTSFNSCLRCDNSTIAWIHVPAWCQCLILTHINKDERSANHCNLLVGQMMMMNILKVLEHLKQASPVVSLQGGSLLPGGED